MKRLVNGEMTELTVGGVEVVPGADRLLVRTTEGMRTALSVRKGDDVFISYRGRTYKVEPEARIRQKSHSGSGELRAPMPGLIVDVLVTAGESVKKGDKVLVLEAMKTQQALVAPFDGLVASLSAHVGDQVTGDALLAVITAPEAAS